MRKVAENAISEAGIIVKARAGDVSAFCSLVRLHEEKAVRMAYSFTHHWEDARDIAQEAFVKAHENLPKFRGESRFSTWMYRIIANLCKDSFRKKKVRERINAAVGRPGDEDGPDPMERIASNAPDALDETMNRELEQTIHASIETLPQQQKNVFRLRYLQGLSLEEIAGLLELSTGAVKAHLWQASQKMQKLLAGYLAEGGAS